LEEIEELPRGRWFLMPYNIFSIVGKDFYLDFEGEAGYLRHFKTNTKAYDKDILRFSQKAEISTLFHFGPIYFRPLAEGRFTAFSQTKDGSSEDERFTMGAGGNLGIHLWRIVPLKIPFMSIDSLKHTIDPEVSYRNIFFNNLSSNHLIFFDELDTVSRRSFFQMDLRSRLFAKRKGEVYRFLEIHLKQNFFPRRKENLEISQKEFGFLFLEGVLSFEQMSWETAQKAKLLSQTNLGITGDFLYNPYSGKIHRWNAGLQIQENRYSLLFGYRFQENLSEVLTLDLGVKLNEKWSVRSFYQYDFRSERLIQQGYSIRRKLHEWYLSFQLEVDEGVKETRFSINLYPVFLQDSKNEFAFERSQTYHPEIQNLPGF
jgi:hypothetical protein